MGKAAFSAPQSEIAGAIQATRMEQKISRTIQRQPPQENSWE